MGYNTALPVPTEHPLCGQDGLCLLKLDLYSKEATGWLARWQLRDMKLDLKVVHPSGAT